MWVLFTHPNVYLNYIISHLTDTANPTAEDDKHLSMYSHDNRLIIWIANPFSPETFFDRN